jgi:hypothetical protein
MTNDSHGDEPVRTNLEQFGKSTGQIDRALWCLNGLSSFVAFEKLEGLSSHQSYIFHQLAIHNVFGFISAWKPELSANQNDKNTASLLIDLKANGLNSVQLLGHLNQEPDEAPARAFYFNYGYPDFERYKALLLSLCNKYDQPAIAAYESNQIRIFDAGGRVEKVFNLSTMKPTHLRKIWSDMIKQKFVWLESGYLTGAPIWACGPMYDSAGLISDLPLRFAEQGFVTRYRPLREREEVEHSKLAKIRVDSEILAARILKARQRGDVVSEQKSYDALTHFCSLHKLDQGEVMKAAIEQKASGLVVNLLRTQRSGTPERVRVCYERLESFCIDQKLNVEEVIATNRARLSEIWGPG